MIPQLPPRSLNSHKGDFGRVVVIGGSRGMSGAVALAGMAALRSGAGLVTLAVPNSCLNTVAQFDPCYMTLGLPDNAQGELTADAWRVVRDHLVHATAVACGLGLGRSAPIVEGVARLYEELAVPVIVDADGLNALAQAQSALDRPGGPRLLTPHLGEFRRLTGQSGLSMADAIAMGPAWSRHKHVTLILKGHRSLVTDGESTAQNETGNPGMATGGAGDVLTGIAAALVARQTGTEHWSLWDGARLAAWVHGRAGDLASDKLGQTALTARDIVSFLPTVFQSLERESGASAASP